jgi:NAD-dependent deacetylase
MTNLSPLQLSESSRVVVLTGAGISAESGIPTFRDSNGLWHNHKVEEVASPEGWQRDPKLVWQFYSQRRLDVRTCEANVAHKALAELEARLGERFLLVTQNVDDLHEKAGSKRIIHMHGELAKSRCENGACERAPFLDAALYFDELPRCACGGMLRPHLVWFGEVPFEMHRIKRSVQAADIFITVGSSGAVHPAASLVGEMQFRRQQGESVRSIYVGLEAPQNAAHFQDVYLGRATEVLPKLLGPSAGLANV